MSGIETPSNKSGKEYELTADEELALSEAVAQVMNPEHNVVYVEDLQPLRHQPIQRHILTQELKDKVRQLEDKK